MYFSRDVISLKKTYGEKAHVKELFMLPVMTSGDDNEQENGIHPLAKKFVFMFNNDWEHEPGLLSADKQ